jgi:hypothetical protein
MKNLSFILSIIAMLYGITMLLHYNHTTEVCIAVAFVLVVGVPVLFGIHKDEKHVEEK